MKTLLASIIASAFAGSLAFAVSVGSSAPSFSVQGSDGTIHKLEDYKGKFVVLEWHNKDCPFVKKQYDTGNMQKVQKKWTAKNVVWLAVVSSAPGKQGYVTATDAEKDMTQHHAVVTTSLLDSKGEMGKLYGARTTPHMFVIDPEGKVIYNGAIDDQPTADKDSVGKSKNYVDAALEEATTGKKVSVSNTTPYGCSVKYQ